MREPSVWGASTSPPSRSLLWKVASRNIASTYVEAMFLEADVPGRFCWGNSLRTPVRIRLVSKTAVWATWARSVSFASSLRTESTSKIVLYLENLKISPLKPKTMTVKVLWSRRKIDSKQLTTRVVRGWLHQRLGQDWRTVPWNTFLNGHENSWVKINSLQSQHTST